MSLVVHPRQKQILKEEVVLLKTDEIKSSRKSKKIYNPRKLVRANLNYSKVHDLVRYRSCSIYFKIESVWLGATDIAKEGTWLSAEKNTTLTYENWYPGQPNNNDGNQNCLSLYEPFNHTWCDEDCSELYQYICERKVF